MSEVPHFFTHITSRAGLRGGPDWELPGRQSYKRG